jgi:hypothetical protein
LQEWVKRNQEREFDVVLGVWTLSYMQEQDVDQFLEWCFEKVQFLILIEPVHQGPKKKEIWLDIK